MYDTAVSHYVGPDQMLHLQQCFFQVEPVVGLGGQVVGN